MKTIAIVAGALANKPFNSGAAWTRLSWVLGLRQLGFEVCFLEQIDPSYCRGAQGDRVGLEASLNLAFFKSVTQEFGLDGCSALICGPGQSIYGMTRAEVVDLACRTHLLLNMSGHLKWQELLNRIPLKVYLDLDPGFTQIWHLQGQGGLGLDQHDFHFTVGENIGKQGCSIPQGGVDWLPIRQPSLLDHWPAAPEGALDRFTTAASWRGPYGPVRWAGRTFGPKAHQFRKFLDLPARTGKAFEIALDIHPDEKADLRKLLGSGWKLADPRSAIPDPGSFRRYVQNSGAEFSVAQGVYVGTSSGWFSDRTVRYLSSGRPALVQDTGFSRNIPCGDGLLAFRTLQEAVQGVEEISRRYPHHCRAARRLAEECFDARQVLAGLLNRIGVS